MLRDINLVILLSGYLTLASSIIHELPPYIKPCKRHDPQLNQCLLSRTEEVREYLVKGIPELGLRTIEPFIVPEISLEQGTEAINVKALLKNVEIRGLSTYKFSKFDAKLDTLEWFCEATIGRLQLEGDYDIKGKILLVPIDNKGRFTASIDDSKITLYQRAELYKKKGQDHLRPVNTTTTIVVGGPKAKLHGLEEGNAEVGQLTNRVIEDNVNDLFQDLKPSIEKVINNVVEVWLINTIEKNIPFSKLYPES